MEPGQRCTAEGRRVPENVTCAATACASLGPMPRTRSSSAKDPNGPRCARSATIRAASAGPIRGSRSSDAESATSTSTSRSVGGCAPPADSRFGSGCSVFRSPSVARAVTDDRRRRWAVAPPLRPAVRPARTRSPASCAESTANSCALSASLALGKASPACRQYRIILTPAPTTITASSHDRARRSPVVSDIRAPVIAPAYSGASLRSAPTGIARNGAKFRARGSATAARGSGSAPWRPCPPPACSRRSPCLRCRPACGGTDSRYRSRRSP